MKQLYCVIAVVLAFGAHVLGQQGPGRQGGAGQAAAPEAPPTPRASAPIDLTGYWVSIVNEDWRWRMMTPPKGDYASLPLTPQARKAADSWDYAKEQGTEDACKPFGVGGLIRMPGRLHITWQDDVTLKIEFDAGSQTRLLYFDARQGGATRTWQGHSQATWERAGLGPVDRNGIPAGGGRGGRGGRGRGDPQGGSLKVVTTNFKAGHLRKNGVPYSENATIEEYFDRLNYPNGDVILLVRTTIQDPLYLTMPFLTSTNFKREPDGSKWKPTPCAIDPPVVMPKSQSGSVGL
jgi:hypothetical protein